MDAEKKTTDPSRVRPKDPPGPGPDVREEGWNSGDLADESAYEGETEVQQKIIEGQETDAKAKR